MRLKGKIIIKGTLTTVTGLHIGGEKSSLAIGGIDNNVIKSAKGVPYIPGSSLKGKLRSLLAQKEGSLFFSEKDKEKALKSLDTDQKKSMESRYENLEGGKNYTDEDHDYIMELFGFSGDNEKNKDRVGHTQLLVRDAYWKKENQGEWLDKFTHSKMENVINRRTGTAEHPREIERVPSGAEFAFELVYNIYQENDFKKHLECIVLALELLEDDYIGGLGSRGYGQVKVTIKEEDLILKEIVGDAYEMSENWTFGGVEHEALNNFKNALTKI